MKDQKKAQLHYTSSSLEEQESPKRIFTTKRGVIYHGDSRVLMQSVLEPQSIDLIMTSPPFGLLRKKTYGNKDADQYLEWFEDFAKGFVRVLKPDGSLVIDIAGGWERGQPTRSLYHYELLLMLVHKYKFYLAQEFFWWNPAKLPNPAEWVNIRHVRVKDAVNYIWWLSLTPYPKASNKRVLQPYSESMKELLQKGYKPKLRPSGHNISDKFSLDNGGAIPPNLLALANTESDGSYQRYCKDQGLPVHPARFPAGIPTFFIRMLTDPRHLVLDPFAGSCVTGEVSEQMGRQWICCEIDEDYVKGAMGRFTNENDLTIKDAQSRRKEPYEVYPPHLFLLDEENSALVQDGGRHRPKLGGTKSHHEQPSED